MELKKILIYITSICLIFILFNIGLDYIFSNLYKHNTNGQSGGKINYYQNLKPEPDILILGNSRALYQVIPDSFKNTNTYNLCSAGMDDCFQLGLLHYILKIGKKPKTILLQIDPEYYIDNVEGEFISKDIQHLKYYYNKDELIKSEIDKMSQFEFIKNNIPLYKYNGRVISLIKNYFQSKNDFDKCKGFIKINATKFDSTNTIIAYNSKKRFEKTNYSIDKAKYLIQIIDLCKKDNVNLICFTSPHFKYDHKEFNNINDNLHLLFEKENIKYINLDEDTMLTNKLSSPVYWKDHMHLNLDGAKIISPHLSHLLDL